MRSPRIKLLLLLFFLHLTGCGSSDPFPALSAPTIASLSPTNRVNGFPDFTLTVNGSGFVSVSEVEFDDIPVTTVFMSGSQLVATVPASLIKNLGPVPVTVVNPAVAGGTSSSQLFTVRSHNFSVTPMNVSNTAASSITPRIAVDGSGNINVVWDEDGEIFFSRSVDGGVSFSANKNVSSTLTSSITPAIAIDGSGNINVVWDEDGEIFFSRSADGGVSFSANKNVSSTLTSSITPAIAVDGSGNINVVWDEDGEIFFSRSTDSGVNFSPGQNISNNPGTSRHPGIAVQSSGSISIVWDDTSAGGSKRILFIRATTTPVVTFSDTVNVSQAISMSSNPSIAVDSLGNINVVWEDENLDIYFGRSTDSGTSFSTPIAIFNSSGSSEHPSLATDGLGNINVIWQDGTSGEIFFSRSTNGGASFSMHQNLSDNSGNSIAPAIAVDASGNIYTVWEDDTTGNAEILFSLGN